jgi:hypothetical protein
MTVNQEIALFDKERKLSHAIKVVFFNSVLLHREKMVDMPAYKKLLFEQNETSLESTSDDSKRDIEMLMDDSEISPLIRAGTFIGVTSITTQSELQLLNRV